MAPMPASPNLVNYKGEDKWVKLTTFGHGYMAPEEPAKAGPEKSRPRGVTFGKDADVGGLPSGSSDSSQGTIPKDRDAILRAARVTGEETGREKAREDLARCKSALRELEGVWFPTAESEEQLRGKLAGCVIREANLGEGNRG